MRTAKPLNAVLVLATMGALTLLSACDFFDQPDFTYDDDPQLEFFPLSETADEGEGAISVRIQLIGPQRDDPLNVNFVIGEESTAEEGEQFALSNTSATIPAGESTTTVTIDVLDNDLDDSDTNYELFLVLQDSEGVEAAENLKTFTLTIRGEDEEEDGGGEED